MCIRDRALRCGLQASLLAHQSAALASGPPTSARATAVRWICAAEGFRLARSGPADGGADPAVGPPSSAASAGALADTGPVA
eukprot:4912760-Alexandrium_andersonii.AAC.1